MSTFHLGLRHLFVRGFGEIAVLNEKKCWTFQFKVGGLVCAWISFDIGDRFIFVGFLMMYAVSAETSRTMSYFLFKGHLLGDP